MKKLLSIALALVLIFALVGCATQPVEPAAPAATPAAPEAPATPEEPAAEEEPAAPPVDDDRPLEIAVVVKITGIPFFNVMEDGVRRAAEELGVNAFTVGPVDADPALQVRLIDDLIATGVDALVVVPNDASVLEPVLLRAQEEGILVITNESPGQVGADYNIELIDNRGFALDATRAVAEAAGGEGEFVLFVGGLGVPLHNLWADYTLEYLAENFPNMTQATDRLPVGEDVDLARTTTLDLIAAHPDLRLIIGYGSLGPIGAAVALRERDMIGDIVIGGTVIPSQAATHLQDGSITQGVLWNPADAGFATVYAARFLLQGGNIADLDIPGLGRPLVTGPNDLAFDATLIITADNADDLGF